MQTLHQLGQIDGVLLYREDPRTSPRYTPKHREDYARQMKSKKEPMRSMGPSKVLRPSPRDYLKKQQKTPDPPKGERHVCGERKPEIPDSKNRLRLVRKRFDYVSAAIAERREVDRSKPESVADSHRGHTYLAEDSGLFPQHVNKKEYGKVPSYVRERAADERSRLEDDCDRLEDEKELAVQERLRKQGRALTGLRRVRYQITGESSRVSAMMEARLVRTHQRRLEEKLLGVDTGIERARKRLERLAVREKSRSSKKCP